MPVWSPPDRGFQTAHPILAGLMNSLSLNPVQTTIGPGAIPLSDPDAYLRKVAGATIGDIGEHVNLPTSTASSVSRNTPAVSQIIGTAAQDPTLASKVQAETMSPGIAASLMRGSAYAPPPGYIDKVIQALADAYHSGMGK